MLSGTRSGASFVQSLGGCSEDIFFSDGDSGDEVPDFSRFLATAAPIKRVGHKAKRRPSMSVAEGTEQEKVFHENMREGKSMGKAEDECCGSRHANPFPKKRQHLPEVVPILDLISVVPGTSKLLSNYSDAAARPREDQGEDSRQEHKSWRLGEAVVAVEPSGFSDDEGSDDLFSDSFREKVFRSPQHELGARNPAASINEKPRALAILSKYEEYLGSYDCDVRSRELTSLPATVPANGRGSSARSFVCLDSREKEPAVDTDGCARSQDRIKLLEEYKAEHGHVHVPHAHTFQHGQTAYFVNEWRVRYRKGNLESAIQQKLEELGFEWDGTTARMLRQEAQSAQSASACVAGKAAAGKGDNCSSEEHEKSFFARLAERLSNHQASKEADERSPGPCTSDSRAPHEPITLASCLIVSSCISGETIEDELGISALAVELARPAHEHVTSSDSNENEDAMQEVRAGGGSFHYELSVDGIEDSQDEREEDDEKQLDQGFDQGSQFHYCGDISIEVTPSETVQEEEDRIESSLPDEEMYSKICSNERIPLSIKPAMREHSKHSEIAGQGVCQASGTGEQATMIAASVIGLKAEKDRSLEEGVGFLHNVGSLDKCGISQSPRQSKSGLAVNYAATVPLVRPLDCSLAPDPVSGGLVGFTTGTGKILVAKTDACKFAHTLLGGVINDMQASSFRTHIDVSAPIDRVSSVSALPSHLVQTAERNSKASPPSSCRSSTVYNEQSLPAIHATADDSSVCDDVPVSTTSVDKAMPPSLTTVPTPFCDLNIPDGVVLADNGLPGASHVSDMPAVDRKVGDEDMRTEHKAPEAAVNSVGPSALPERASSGSLGMKKSFSYHLPEDPTNRVANFESGGVGAGSIVSFKTGKGKSLAPTAESLKSATSIFGSLLGDLNNVDGTGFISVPAHVSSAPIFPRGTGRIVEPSQDSMQRVRVSYGGSSATGSAIESAPIEENSSQRESKDHTLEPASVWKGASSCSTRPLFDSSLPGEDRGGPQFTRGTGRLVQPSEGSLQRAQVSYGNHLKLSASGVSSVSAPCASRKTSSSMPFDYGLSGGEISKNSREAVSFKTGTGRSVGVDQSMSRAASASIFGSILDDMQALQTSQKQDRTSQHTHDTVIAEESHLNSTTDLRGEHEPTFTMGTGKVVHPSHENMRKVAAKYGGNTGLSSTCTLMQDNDGPAFTLGGGKIVKPSQESMQVVHASYGGHAAATTNAHASTDEPVFSKGTGKVVHPSQESLLRTQASYGGMRALCTMSADKDASAVSREAVSFKTGTGRSVGVDQSMSRAASASIFGSILDDMQALQTSQKQDRTSQHTHDTVIAEESHLNSTTDLRGEHEPTFTMGTGKVVHPSHENMRKVAAKYGGNTGLSSTCTLMQDNDGPAFTLGGGKIVKPSQESMQVVHASYGGHAAATTNAHASTDEPVFSKGTGKVVHPSQESLLRTQASYGGMRALCTMSADKDASAVSREAVSFKTGTGRSVGVDQSMSRAASASIFGSILDDMQALQTSQKQDRTSQHTHDTVIAEESHLNSTTDLRGEHEPTFTMGTGKVVHPSHENMRKVAAKYGGNTGLSSTCTLMQDNDGPAFTLGGGKIVKPSQESMQVVHASYGGHAAATTNAHASTDEPVFSKGTGKVVHPSQESLLRTQASYGGMRALCTMSADKDASAVSREAVSFKTGTGRSVGVDQSMSRAASASIFGSILDDMQALQTSQKQDRTSQHTHDTVIAEESHLNSTTDLRGEHEPTFTMGTGKVVHPSHENMRKVAAKYGGNTGLSSTCTLMQDNDGPAFTLGGGKIVKPSQESMQVVHASYGGHAAATTNAHASTDEPVFSKGTGKVVHPSQESLLRTQASYGGMRALCTMSADKDASAVSSLTRPPTATLSAVAFPVVHSFLQSTTDSTLNTPSSSYKPLVPKFKNHASSMLDKSDSSFDFSSMDMGSRINLAAPAKRPGAAVNDRRAFKVPRKLVTPVLVTPSACASSANNCGLDQGICSPYSTEELGHQTPMTPGGMTSNSKGMSTSSLSKALATPRHLFSPETAMKITGFRVTNAALMGCSNMSFDASTPNQSIENTSVHNPDVAFDSVSASASGFALNNLSTMSVEDSVSSDFSAKQPEETQSLSLPLQEAVQHTMPFEDWTNGNIEIKDYMKIRQISRNNAVLFKFSCGATKFFAMTGDNGDSCKGGAEVQQLIGLEEMYAVLQERTQESNNSCPDMAWAENHYSLIVWKLASMERAFPSIFGGRWLTPDRVMLQLLNRYEKEVAGGTRSVLLQIKQRDQVGSQHLVLCVSGIDGLQGEQVTLELMDGWHTIQALLSPTLAQLTRQGKIFIGQKLRLYGSDSTQEEGKDASLKIGSNGTRRAEWHSKLGAHMAPPPFVSVRSIKPGEGVVPAILVVVQRVFPIVHMDSLVSGEKVWRSTKAEEAAQAAAQNAQQEAWENFVAAQMKIENLESEIETSEGAAELRDKMEEWRKDFVKSQVERKTCSVMRIKVACMSPSQQQQQYPAEAYVTIWRPQESSMQEVQEGAVLELHNLAVGAICRNELACLSSMKGTKCRRPVNLTMEQQEQAAAAYCPRTYYDISQLHRAGNKQDVDLVGVAVAVSHVYTLQTHKGPKPMQAIVLTCPCAHDADKEDESFVVVRLDLTGLVPIKVPSDRARKSPDLAVFAVKNVKEVARISLHGDDSDCNVFACSAREDTEILYSAPVGVGGIAAELGEKKAQVWRSIGLGLLTGSSERAVWAKR